MTSPAARLRQRRWMRRMAKEIEPHRFAAFGAGSRIHPPGLVIGHERIAVGRDVVIHGRCFLSVVPGGELTIGDGSRLGFDLSIGCAGRVEIGARVLAADRVFIGDVSHAYRDPGTPVIDQGLTDARPVRVDRGAFLGIGSIVLPGVTVGENAYVGAGAVVTADVEPRSLVVGNPARVVRRHDGERWVDV